MTVAIFCKRIVLSKHEKKNYSEQYHDKSRYRKHERISRKKSVGRESHSRDRSDGRENYKKSKSVKSNNNWMSSNGEELKGSENSEVE